jgi:transcriptional regulator with PAS, ATPase and Fis domain
MTKTASSNASVIIYGESGTGKELAAQTIHNLSPRRHKRLIPVNCGAIPEELIESEFFGYKKGAFTGAQMNKPGYLDWADRGTLFLDEVGELSLAMQIKLLRAVDGGGYSPIGSRDVKKPDIRIIAATNRDLRESVRDGLMREDFYYRINVLPISMPPLRARKDDLPLLINHFLVRFSKEKPTPVFPSKLMDLMKDYHWPGNIRELQNTIQRYVTLNEIGFLKSPRKTAEAAPEAFPEFRSDQDLKSAKEKFEKQYISQCLEATYWHRDSACAILKINRKTLYKKMKRYRLKRDRGTS